MEKIGKYEIVRKLGSGATSTVYLAVDEFSRRQVAIKLFDLKVMQDTGSTRIYRKLLMTEASLVGKLSHPHIARVFDAVMDGDVNYMVMEYIEGCTLDRYAEASNLLPIPVVAEIIYKCCKALEYAQSQGVIHRDIKPANILLQGETNIKIYDFGSAAIQDQQTTQVSGVGSPAYMSPEQVKEMPLTHQTDIYSLGVVMHKLLTGRLPFEASNNFSMIYQIINIEPSLPSAFRPEIPLELDTIVGRAMCKDTAGRYQTWEAFSRDVAGFFGQDAALRKGISDTEKFEALRSLNFFNGFDDVELWEVLRISEWRKVPQDEYILRDGESGRTFYVIAHGTVNVVKQGRLLSILQRGDCFGEMAHLSEHEFVRSTDVVARNDVILIEINPDVLVRASAGCRFHLSDAFLRMLVKRLAMANKRVSHLLSDHEPATRE